MQLTALYGSAGIRNIAKSMVWVKHWNDFSVTQPVIHYKSLPSGF